MACETLGSHWVSAAQRRAMVRVLREELGRTSDSARLLQFARRWLYEHRMSILRARELRTEIAKAIGTHKRQLACTIGGGVEPALLDEWRTTLTRPRERGTTVQGRPWAAPAKHSSRQIEEVLEPGRAVR